MIDLNEVRVQYPQQIHPWLEVKLTDEHMKYLWKIVKKGEERGRDMKPSLAGNISTSFALEDENYYFTSEVLMPLTRHYENVFPGGVEPKPSEGMDSNGNRLKPTRVSLSLESFWANYQYKHEFNPVHDHGGAFSFVIWMKIPYNCDEQKKIKFLNGMDDGHKVPGCFYFDYINLLGQQTSTIYQVSSKYEGTMLLFPAKLRHGVHPFYECDEKRISISGNLDFIYTYDKA